MGSMKTCVNGKVRDLTPEEISELERQTQELPPPEPTTDERLAALEAAMLEMIMGGAV